MEKDSYPRFLKSNIYLNLLNDLQASSLKWGLPGWQELKDGIKDRRKRQRHCLRDRLGLLWWLSRPGGRTNDSERLNREPNPERDLGEHRQEDMERQPEGDTVILSWTQRDSIGTPSDLGRSADWQHRNYGHFVWDWSPRAISSRTADICAARCCVDCVELLPSSSCGWSVQKYVL